MTTTNLPTRLPLADQEEDRDADEHAAEPGDAQLAIVDLEQPGEGALDRARMHEGRDALEHEEQRERGEQIGEIHGHGAVSQARSALGGTGILQILEEFAV